MRIRSIGIIGEESTFIAVDGEHEATVTPERISLKMGNVDAVERSEDFVFMDTGSPHYVSFIDGNIKDFAVVDEGKAVRYNDRFKAEGTNVNFVEKLSENNIFVRTYERGVENETLSCGTGVTACVLSCAVEGYESPVAVKTLGGDLSISFSLNIYWFTIYY